MKREIAKAWVAALRSGDYVQGHEFLRTHDTFCCLGVLCNLHALAHPDIAAQQPSKKNYMGCTTFLPKAVRDWAGMRTVDGYLPQSVSIGGSSGGSSGIWTLSGANDRNIKFPRLADLIEEHWIDL